MLYCWLIWFNGHIPLISGVKQVESKDRSWYCWNFLCNWFKLAGHKLGNSTLIHVQLLFHVDEDQRKMMCEGSACQELSLQWNYRLLCEQIHRFSEIWRCVRLWDTGKRAVCVESLQLFCRAQEKEASLPDFIRISVELLPVSSECAGNCSKASISSFIPHS